MRHGLQIKTRNRLHETSTNVLRTDHSEEGAGSLVHVDDMILRVGDDDPLEDCVEDRFQESLLLGEDLEVMTDVVRFNKSDPLDKFVDEPPVH